jgi:hypothetical protein
VGDADETVRRRLPRVTVPVVAALDDVPMTAGAPNIPADVPAQGWQWADIRRLGIIRGQHEVVTDELDPQQVADILGDPLAPEAELFRPGEEALPAPVAARRMGNGARDDEMVLD